MHRGAFQRFDFMRCIGFGSHDRLHHRRFGGQTADFGPDIRFLTPEGLAGKNVFDRQIEEKRQQSPIWPLLWFAFQQKRDLL